MNPAGVVRSQRRAAGKVAAALSAFAVGCFLMAGEPARADTMIWSNGNDAGPNPGPVIQEFDANTGARITAFPDPAATPSQFGRGIAVVGSNIFYSLDSSTSVFLTNTSGANLGTAFVVNIPGVIGVQSIASDGQFLYITPLSNTLSLNENVYKYDFSGDLIASPVTLVPSGGIVQGARDGLEIVGNTFVANQPRLDIGPYDQFNGGELGVSAAACRRYNRNSAEEGERCAGHTRNGRLSVSGRGRLGETAARLRVQR